MGAAPLSAVIVTKRPRTARVLLLAALAVMPSLAGAQTLPAGPARLLDGRLLVAGDATATIGPQDNIAFFNYTDYQHNALRTFRVGVSALWQPARWLALVGDFRSDDLEAVRAHAAYVRVRPWRNRPFDVQAGRIPPSFGAFGRRTYAADEAFIGDPLGYQYLTSLRYDAVPATADDLLRMRARGWRASYPIGEPLPGPGMPIMSAFRWDTGIQAHWAGTRADAAVSVTNGTLSHPRIADDNDGKQVSGRLGLTPVTGLTIGASAARGPWAVEELPGASNAIQSAMGLDAEYSRAQWLVRGELLHSRWSLPVPLRPANTTAVSSTAAWIEGRYRLTPRIFAGVRADTLGFSKITGTLFQGRPTPWDAPVQRVEAVAGYYFQRNLVARLGVQKNWRDAGRVRERTYISAQLSYWF
jgi:hypothetical protein